MWVGVGVGVYKYMWWSVCDINLGSLHNLNTLKIIDNEVYIYTTIVTIHFKHLFLPVITIAK